MKKIIPLLSFLFFCFTANAQLEWVKVTTGWQNVVNSAGMVVDDSGNTYSAGDFYGTADFDPGPGVYELTAFNNFDSYVRKLNSSGDLVWVITFGGSKNETTLGIAMDNNQEILITGHFRDTADFDPGPGVFELISSEPTIDNGFAVKLDLDGNFVWAKSFPSIHHSRVKTAVFNASSECFLVGEFSLIVDVNPNVGTATNTSNYGGVFVTKLDADGNFIWGGSFPGEGWNESYGIDDTPDGGCVITGHFEDTTDFDPGSGTQWVSPNLNNHIFLVKLGPSGTLDWLKTYGSAFSHMPGGVAVSNQGNYYLTGDFSGTANFNPAGTPQEITATGGNTFILKLDSSGNFLWVKGIDGDFNKSTGIYVDSNENCMIAGHFQFHISFNSGALAFDTQWNSDAFVLSLNPSGSFNWAFTIPSSSLSAITGLDKDANGNLYVGGVFFGTTDFDPGPGTVNIAGSTVDRSVFTFKLNSTLSVKDLYAGEYSIYPNPAKNILTIYSDFDQTESIVIYDLTGSEIKSIEHSSVVDVSELSPGTYLLVRNSSKETSQLFVKE